MKKSNKQKQVTITCNEKQLYLIELSLEILSRIVSGQLHHVVSGIEITTGKELKVTFPDGEVRSGFNLGNYIEKMIKPILFPELHPNASYGVGMKEIGDAQIMYEMYKKIQNYRARKEGHFQHSVTWHEPLHYSKEPLIKVEDIDNE